MCACPGDCEGGPECLNDEGEPLPDAEEGYVCSRCQRRQHGRCTDPACTCCEGNQEDEQF